MISNRIKKMKPSKTVELTAKVAELRRKGVNVISLNVGEPDFSTPINIRESAKKAIDDGFTKYTAVAGIVELREAICEKLNKDNSLTYMPGQISVGTGAKQPLVNSILAICDVGDEIILPTPCWVSYIEMIVLAGGIPVLVPTVEEKGFALDIEKIESSITSKTKGILINTPNNPTGAVYNEESLRRLGELAVKHNFYIVSDEVYEKLVYEGEKHISIASLSADIKCRTITINGFSKAYAMTGWRIGYAAAEEEIIKGMNAIQSHMTSGTNSITQIAALEAINGPQDDIEKMQSEFDKRRMFVIERLRNMEGISCQNVKGAFYVMPNVSAFFGKCYGERKIENAIDLAKFLLDEANVAVVDGDAFEAPNCIRISYSNSMENLVIAMDKIQYALKLLK